MAAVARQPGLTLAGYAALEESDRADILQDLGKARKPMPAVGTTNRVFIPRERKFKIEQVQLVNDKPRWVFIGWEEMPKGKVSKDKNIDAITYSPTLNPTGQIIQATPGVKSSRPVLSLMTPGQGRGPNKTVLPGFRIVQGQPAGTDPLTTAPAAAGSPQALPPVLTLPAPTSAAVPSPATDAVPASLPFPGVTPSAAEPDYGGGWDAVPLEPASGDDGFTAEPVPGWEGDSGNPSEGDAVMIDGDQGATFNYQDYVLSGMNDPGMGSWFSKAAKSIMPAVGSALSLIPGVGTALGPLVGSLSKLLPAAGQPNQGGQNALQQIINLVAQVGGALVKDKTSTTAKVFQAVQQGTAATLPPGVFQGPDGKLYRIVPKATAAAAAARNGTASVAAPGMDQTTVLLLVGGALLLASRK